MGTPLVEPFYPYVLVLGIDVLIAVIFATSLHFIMGPGGMHSFGHAAYFGLGAYGAGLLVKFFAASMPVALLMTPVVAGAGALLFGWFAVRLSGVYLAMLTLAFAQIVWSIVFQWENVTGGSNGILGIWPTGPFDAALELLPADARRHGLRRTADAPDAVLAVRLCDARRPQLAAARGSDRHQRQARALDRALRSPARSAAWPAACSPSPRARSRPRRIAVGRSIDGLVMVLLGGIQTLIGPIVGAPVFVILQDTIMRQTEFWRATARRRDPAAGPGVPRRHRRHARQVDRQRQAKRDGAAMSVLSVAFVAKSFGGVRAVDDVSFDVEQGEFLALIGPNGAGKSTCFNMINGQLAPDGGDIQLAEHSIVGLKPRDIWRLGVGRTFQVAATFGSMTVVENVQLALASFHGEIFRFTATFARRHRERALELLAQVGMADAADRACKELAYGDVKRVELAIALANDPRLLLMDEPTAGMAPRERNDLIALVKRLVIERGISVLFTEHSMDVVFAYADRIIVLARGVLIADGDAQAIRDNRQVQEVYLGTGKTCAARRCHAMSEPMLEVTGLKAWYGAAQILYDLTFHVGRGEVVALMGRNGAGKSTTIKTLMGLIAQPRRYRAFPWRGYLAPASAFEIARRGLGFVPEDRRIFSDLTVLENLDIGRQPPRQFPDGRPAPSWTPEKLFTLFPNLGRMPDRLGAHMSGGEQQMLTVARTLMGNPLLVLLDEPSEGVAPVIVEQMANTIVELKKEGLSVLLSEQNIHFAELVSDRVYVLEKGQLQWQGRMSDLAGDVTVQRSFLSV